MDKHQDTVIYPEEVITVISERLIRLQDCQNTDTTIMYQTCEEDTIYETPIDGDETKLWKLRSNLFKEMREMFSKNKTDTSQEEFRRYFEGKELLNCNTTIISETSE